MYIVSKNPHVLKSFTHLTTLKSVAGVLPGKLLAVKHRLCGQNSACYSAFNRSKTFQLCNCSLTPHFTAVLMSLHLQAGRVHGSKTEKHHYSQKYRLIFESFQLNSLYMYYSIFFMSDHGNNTVLNFKKFRYDSYYTWEN